MKYILALDQGTTSSRAVLISREGNIHSAAQKEFTQLFPSPGWVEHDPQEIWSSQASCISEVVAKGQISPDQIAAIGITNQRETTVVWDRKSGKPLANAIVWQDRRTTEICQELKGKGLEPLFQQKTGLLLDPYFSGTKLFWILRSIPGALERAKKGGLAFGTVDTWLLWKLTGGACHMTDVSNASRTLLFNIHTLKWDEDLLKILNIPKEILPEVRSSSEIYGKTNTPLLAGSIPISGIAGDQQAALIGQACFSKGMVKTTYGTGCFLLMNTGSQPVASKNNLLTTIAYQIKDEIVYALEGSVFNGGAVVQWIRDNLGLIKKSADIEKLAASVPDSEGVFFVPAFTGLGAPYWDPYARGTLVGLTRGSTAAHIARSALDSIAFQVRDVLKAMQADAGMSIAEIRVDGGAVENNLLMQFQADLMGAPVIRPKVTELTALGAAFLAGIAIGFWKNKEEAAASWQKDKTFTPAMPADKVQILCRKWEKAIDCAQNWEQS
ncbi:MAG TPA: glycerol kinase GlpK [Rhabdochlamydiaceae bacterium]|nr:glycerol kinase GlpK [Rhabdochlamydiaceae bacterium]